MTRRVAFSETDLAGIAHFSNYFRYMEDAEHAFYRSLGFSVHPAEAKVGWPRVKAACEFRAPLHFEEEFEVELLVEEVRRRSIRYRCHIWKRDPRVLAGEGDMVVVCVELTPKIRAVEIPAGWREKLETAPAHLLAPIPEA